MVNELKGIYIKIFEIIGFNYSGDYLIEDMQRSLENQSFRFVSSETEAEVNRIMSDIIQELKKGKIANMSRINKLVEALEYNYNYSRYWD